MSVFEYIKCWFDKNEPSWSSAMKMFRRLIAASALIAFAVPAGALQVTGGFTGLWGQPDQQNHGLMITISRLPGGEKTGVVYWAIFEDGAPSWVFAQGDVDGDTINADVFRFEGISFMQPQNPAAAFGERIGTLQVEFTSCINGRVTFNTVDLGAGEFEIGRLDNPPGRNCTGGLADDRRPNRERERIEVALEGDGTGFAELDLRPGRAHFEVKVRELPVGDGYELRVAGETRGEFEVFETAAGGTRGQIEFRSPQIGPVELLDFDPRGELIEVADGGVVVSSAMLPEEGGLPGRDTAPFDHDFQGRAVREIEFELDNLGLLPGALATAELVMGGGRMEFEIELIGAPVGSYPLSVAGVQRGVIEVLEEGRSGALEFGYPEDDGQRRFDFDPAGALVEIFSGEMVAFEGTFPDFRGDGCGGGQGPGGGNGPGDGPGHGGMHHGCGDIDEVHAVFDNVGGAAYAGASASAEYEAHTNRSSFEVEVESMPAGSYPLVVEGVQRGVIDVFEDGDGEIEFGDPPRFDENTLDFDPRGASVEIVDGDGPVFTLDFPQ